MNQPPRTAVTRDWQRLAGSPDPGQYPDGHAGYLREWDGHAWRNATAAPEQPALAHRHSLLRAVGGWWFLVAVVGYAVAIGAGVLGEQNFALPVRGAATVGTLAVLVWFVALVHRRLDLKDAIGLPALIGLGLVIGVLGFVLAYWLEGLMPSSFTEDLSTGPFEALGKLLIPIVLWLAIPGFRDPRRGFAVVLVSAAVFGLIEAWEYTVVDFTAPTTHTVHHTTHDTIITEGSDADYILQMAIQRPWAELLHPMFAGFAAAVVWRSAWLHGRLVTWAGIGAIVLVMVLHSAFDSSDHALRDLFGSGANWANIVLAVVLILAGWFVLLRPGARQLVPPTAVEANARGWRPAKTRVVEGAPKSSPGA